MNIEFCNDDTSVILNENRFKIPHLETALNNLLFLIVFSVSTFFIELACELLCIKA